MGVMRYNGNKGVFFVCAQTKEKGKINYVWKEQSRKSKKTKVFVLINWKYGLPELENKFKKGKEIVEVWCYVGLECFVYLDIGACRKVGVGFLFS